MWTPEKLRETRKDLGIRQKDIAEILGMTCPAISAIETGKTTSPWAIQLYGIILERYYASLMGYVPAYRKLGDSKFVSEDYIHSVTLDHELI